MTVRTKRVLGGIGAAVVVLALLIGGTFAYIAYDHRANPFRNAPDYQGRLVEDFEEKDWEINRKIKKEISVKNMGGTAQFPGKNWGDIFARVKLKEHMDITPVDYVYYPDSSMTKTRFMTDKQGRFVKFAATGTIDSQLASIKSNSIWNQVIADNQLRTAFLNGLTAASFIRLRGYYDTQEYWYVITKAGDPNGQYGSFVVIDRALDVTKMQSITGSDRATGIDYGAGHNNGECEYPVHFWDEDEPETCTLNSHGYVSWQLGDSVVMLDDWDGALVDKWILDPVSGWATWGNALKPGQSTGLLLKSITPIKMPDGEMYYIIHADLECTSLNNMGGDWSIKDAVGGGGGNALGISEIVTTFYSGWTILGTQYKIDLINKSLWIKDWGPLWEEDRPWTEEFTFMHALEEDKIESFLAAAQRNGFADWEPWYEYYHIDEETGIVIPPPTDGPVWSVETTFADGTKKNSGGYMTYPDTWDAMVQAFYELTGVEHVWSFAARGPVPYYIPFHVGVQVNTYVRQDTELDRALLVSSKAELEGFMAAYWGDSTVTMPAFAGYDDAFFSAQSLILITRTEPSGGIFHEPLILNRLGNSRRAGIKHCIPQGPLTADMAYWIFALEVENIYVAGVTDVEAEYYTITRPDRFAQVDDISIAHYNFSDTLARYRIDLKNKEFWIYNLSGSGYEARALADDKIEAFRYAAHVNFFHDWGGGYGDQLPSDGRHWSVEAYFSDRMNLSSHGSNAYPANWDAMALAFYELTGENILIR